MTTSILSHYEEKPARVNGMLGKTDFEKNEKQKTFDAVSVFIRQ